MTSLGPIQNDMTRLRPALARLDMLVVDDAKEARKILTSCLRAFGVGSIREAEDAIVALDAARVKRPDVIFTDWEMKPENGVDFVRKIRRAENGALAKKTRIVMVTAHAEETVVRDALAAGANQYVVKPIQPGRLFERLRAALLDRREMRLVDGGWTF